MLRKLIDRLRRTEDVEDDPYDPANWFENLQKDPARFDWIFGGCLTTVKVYPEDGSEPFEIYNRYLPK